MLEDDIETFQKPKIPLINLIIIIQDKKDRDQLIPRKSAKNVTCVNSWARAQSMSKEIVEFKVYESRQVLVLLQFLVFNR